MKNINNETIENQSIINLTNEVLDEIVFEISATAEKRKLEFEEAKLKAATAVGINPLSAAEYEVRNAVEKQIAHRIFDPINDIIIVVGKIDTDNYTKLILIWERLEKYAETEKRRLTQHFSFPSSSSQISNSLRGVEMETGFKFFFGGWEMESLTRKISRGIEQIQKLAEKENVPSPTADLAERVQRQTCYNESEFMEVVVNPGFGDSVKITVSNYSQLERAIYTFNVDHSTGEMKLTDYAKEVRPTTRHKNYDHQMIWRRISESPECLEARAAIEFDSYVEATAMQAASMITGLKPKTIG